jgi:hypothetical protein
MVNNDYLQKIEEAVLSIDEVLAFNDVTGEQHVTSINVTVALYYYYTSILSIALDKVSPRLKHISLPVLVFAYSCRICTLVGLTEKSISLILIESPSVALIPPLANTSKYVLNRRLLNDNNIVLISDTSMASSSSRYALDIYFSFEL